jgi:D-alanyl-D-alanine carboxypeptidase (penicillin-binding protein 5/6)
MKKFFPIILCAALLTFPVTAQSAPDLKVNAKSAILMEASTGKILYEQNPHEKLAPASVTKIMTMLLAMEAIDHGKISMDDKVVASERAKSMGGSTIFLDTGEEMSVHDLLKGIAVASGNDAAVAIAEHIAGSEEGFIQMMNQRAQELKMDNTNFVNTNGLDADNHYTSAYDIAIMSRELLKHEDIFKFTTIWTDTLRDGKTDLANTNKLVRFYKGANGLKTGSTSNALYCISATAKREDMQLISVVMSAPTTKDRFDAARTMLDFGFANYSLASPAQPNVELGKVPVTKGQSESVSVHCADGFTVLVPKGQASKVTSKIDVKEAAAAPVKKGDELGVVKFYLDNEMLGEIKLVAMEDVPRKNLGSVYYEIIKSWLR